MSRATSPTSPAIPGGFTMNDTIASTRGSTDEAVLSREASDTAAPSLQWARTNDSIQKPFRGILPRRGSEDPKVDDRIKSRAVNDLGWNWEAERAKMDTGGLSASSSMLRGTSEGGPSNNVSSNGSTANKAFMSHLNSNTIHPEQISSPTGESSPGVISPRFTSKIAANPPRINTSGNNNSFSNYYDQSNSSQQETAQPTSSTADTFSTDALPQVNPSQRLQYRTPQHQMSSSSSKEKSGRRDQTCDACGNPMTGQFVRALGVVFHLDCFRCRVSEEEETVRLSSADDDKTPSGLQQGCGG